MNGNTGNPIIEIPIVLAGILAIGGLVLLTARYSARWNRLEKLYLKRDFTVKHDIGWQYYLEIKAPGVPGLFNSFRSVVALGTNETGLIVKVLWPFRWFLGTLEVPWSEFSVAESDYMNVMPYEIVFSKLPDVQVRISRDAGDRLLALGASRLSLRVVPED